VSAAIEAARARATDERSEERAKTDLERRFDEVVTVLKNLDIDAVWEFVEESERRVFIEELVEWFTIFPVLYSDVGFIGSEIVGVGDPKQQVCYETLAISGLRRPGVGDPKQQVCYETLATHSNESINQGGCRLHQVPIENFPKGCGASYLGNG
jgi:hypothetical protein